MLLSVTTDSDSCSLEVSEDMELENFKALCEAEVNIPSTSMAVIVNGTPLLDNKKSLNQLGVKDGDLVMIVRDDRTAQRQQSSSAASLPASIAQFDFSSIQVPPNYSRGASSSAGPSSRQSSREAMDPVEQHLATPNASTSQSPDSSLQTNSLVEGGAEDPAIILDMLKAHPEQLAMLSHNNPALADAANKGLQEFTRVLNQQQEARKEKERQRIRMLTADPFDPEAQKLIASEIQKQNIDANMEAAMEYHPESFGTVQMLYINCSVNGFPVKAFIDSGAQTTIMSEECARRCNIMRLVDQRWAGIAKGVGTQKIIGRVHMVQLEIAGVYLASSFSILQEQSMDMLLGLDMLKRHQMVIDLQKNVLQIGTTNTSTPFLSEADVPECARITQVAEEKAKLESEQQAREAEDQEIAKALAASAAELDGSSAMDTSTGTAPTTAEQSSTSADSVTEEINVSDADIAEIMNMGFSREEAITELRKHKNDKTNALAALFAKKFAAP